MKDTLAIIQDAKEAKNALLSLDTEKKNRLLRDMAEDLRSNADAILSANAIDVTEASGKISEVMIDRLTLTKDRIEGMAKGIEDVAALPDPVGTVFEEFVRPNGMKIRKIRVPMGVIAMIYESRPNVTSDAAVLTLKAGSAAILRSGKEAKRSAEEIVKILQRSLAKNGLPETAVQLIEDPSHDSVTTIMNARGDVDLLVPRGGKNLIRACVDNSRIPVIETGTGICHVYVDKDADLSMALRIIENAKCSRPSVCNAMEVCLVHQEIADRFVPMLRKALQDDRKANGLVPVEILEDECDTEFLDYRMGLHIVKDADDAIRHIAVHSTHHSDCIVTENGETAERFLRLVDSAAVYHNVSTRFTDGGEFGLGCEIGISTQKLHARGPMGLAELCSYKYIVEGDGQIR